MNKVYFILSLVILAAVAVFAMMNPDKATLHLFGLATMKSTVAVLVICSAAVGAALMALIDLGRHVHGWRETKNLRRQLKAAEEEMNLLRSKKSDDGGRKPEEEKPAPKA